MKKSCQWTEKDLIRAFMNWREMNRAEGANWFAVKEAWDIYTKMRDEMGYRPFPSRMVIARPRIKRGDSAEGDD